jgi:hypothetical protein
MQRRDTDVATSINAATLHSHRDQRQSSQQLNMLVVDWILNSSTVRPRKIKLSTVSNSSDFDAETRHHQEPSANFEIAAKTDKLCFRSNQILFLLRRRIMKLF